MLSNNLSAAIADHSLNPNALLQQLVASGYCLQVKENSLHVSHEKYPPSPQLLQCLKKDKAAIIQQLEQSANANPYLVNEPKASEPAILFSVWEVKLVNHQPMTVIARDEHTLQSMTKAMHRQFGSQRIASITLSSYYAK
jgi:hypothetical protein